MGDSAALFAHVPPKRKAAPEVQALTEDHRLTNPSERRRLAGIAQALAPALVAASNLLAFQSFSVEASGLWQFAGCQLCIPPIMCIGTFIAATARPCRSCSKDSIAFEIDRTLRPANIHLYISFQTLQHFPDSIVYQRPLTRKLAMQTWVSA